MQCVPQAGFSLQRCLNPAVNPLQGSELCSCSAWGKKGWGCMTSCLLCLSFLCAKALPGVMILNSKSLTLWGNAVLAGLSEDSLAPVLYLAKGLCWTIYIQNSSSMCFLSAASLGKATGKGFFVIQWQGSNREPPWGQKVGCGFFLRAQTTPVVHLILLFKLSQPWGWR